MKTKLMIAALTFSILYGNASAAILSDYISCEIHKIDNALTDHAIAVKSSAQYSGDVVLAPNRAGYNQKFVIHHQFSNAYGNYYLITAQSNISRQCITVQKSLVNQQLTQGSCTDPAVQRIWKIRGIQPNLKDRYTIESAHVDYLSWDVGDTDGVKVRLQRQNNNVFTVDNLPVNSQRFRISNCVDADNPAGGVLSIPR